MNRAKSSYFIVDFKKMMYCEKNTINNNTEHTDYLLTHILNDYGVIKLGNTIKTTKEHVDYYEGLDRGNLNGFHSCTSLNSTFRY
ncbi:MAG: hypothetical protein RLZZ419_1398 [Pseudomonadota bacterium]|jgi:hypothetical protein